MRLTEDAKVYAELLCKALPQELALPTLHPQMHRETVIGARELTSGDSIAGLSFDDGLLFLLSLSVIGVIVGPQTKVQGSRRGLHSDSALPQPWAVSKPFPRSGLTDRDGHLGIIWLQPGHQRKSGGIRGFSWNGPVLLCRPETRAVTQCGTALSHSDRVGASGGEQRRVEGTDMTIAGFKCEAP